MQPQSTPATHDPSTDVSRKFSQHELSIMRRRCGELARDLKIAVGKERDAHTHQHSRRNLNKILDVIQLIENALGLDAVELLQ